MDSDKLRVLLIINWKEEGAWFVLEKTRGKLGILDILQPGDACPWGERYGGLSVRLSDFLLPFLAMAGRKRYDVIVSWSMRTGIVYGILNRLFGSCSSARHVIQDFHVNMARKDWKYRLRLTLLDLALPGIDFFMSTSTREDALYSKMFGIAADRIRFLPVTPPPRYLAPREAVEGDFIFAYGNSDRDFDCLVKAVEGLDTCVIILSQTYRPRTALPGHVKLIDTRQDFDTLRKLILEARFVVLPMIDSKVSAGQLSLLEVMAMGRPVIVSTNMATLEYATHLESAVFYPAGDSSALRRCIELFLERPNWAREIGKRARIAAGMLPGKHVEILLDVLRQAGSRVPRRSVG